MFDQLKNLGNMMAQAQKMQSRMTEAKEKIAELRVEGSAGGEMVRVEATGERVGTRAELGGPERRRNSSGGRPCVRP